MPRLSRVRIDSNVAGGAMPSGGALGWHGMHIRLLKARFSTRAKPALRAVLPCFVGVLLGGCTISFPQLELLHATSSVEAASPQSNEVWYLDAGEVGAIVRLYSGGPSGFVFAGEDGEMLAYDGWVIRAVRLNAEAEVFRVTDLNTIRTYSTGRGRVGTIDVKCGSWTKSSVGSNVLWRQTCEGLSKDNSIMLDEAGQVVKISQTISNDGLNITLTRASL